MTLTQTFLQGSHYLFFIAQVILMFLFIILTSKFLILLNLFNFHIISLFRVCCPFYVQFGLMLNYSLIPLFSKISLHNLWERGAYSLKYSKKLKIDLKIFPYLANLWSFQPQQFLTGHFIFLSGSASHFIAESVLRFHWLDFLFLLCPALQILKKIKDNKLLIYSFFSLGLHFLPLNLPIKVFS